MTPEIGSRRAIDKLLTLMMLALSISTGLILLARVLALEFYNLAFILVAQWLAMLGFAAFHVKNVLVRSSSTELKLLFCVAIVAIFGGGIAAATNAPEEDDSAYIPEVVHLIENPSAAINFELPWIVPFNGGEKLTSYFAYLSRTLEVSWGALAHATGLELLILYQVVGSFLFAAAFVLANFSLLTRFAKSTYGALVGVIGITIGVLLLFREDGVGYGVIFNKVWMGKSVLMLVIIPILAGSCFDYWAAPSIKSWLHVFALAFAGIGLSTSALFLVPALLASIIMGSVLHHALKDKLSWRLARIGGALLASSSVLVSIGIVSSLALRTLLLKHESVHYSTSWEIFASGFATFFGKPWSLTTILVGASLWLILARRTQQHAPIVLWAVSTGVLFVNPLTAKLVAENLTSVTAYQRMFLVLPVFAIFGLAVAELSDDLRDRFGYMLPPALLVAIACLYAAALGPSTLIARLDVPKRNILGDPSFGSFQPRVSREFRNDVEVIKTRLSSGNTISSLDYALVVPMLSSQYPQYYSWPPEVIEFFGTVQGHAREAQTRAAAAKFLMGKLEFEAAFVTILRERAHNVILSKRLETDVDLYRKLATKHGYRVVAETDRFVALSRINLTKYNR